MTATWFVENEICRLDGLTYAEAKALFLVQLKNRVLGHYVEGIGAQMWDKTKTAVEAAEHKELKIGCAKWFVKLDDLMRTEGAELAA